MSHDHLQHPRTSASTPCNKGNMAPPTTPIMNTPEATASLDVENETAIQEALSRLIKK